MMVDDSGDDKSRVGGTNEHSCGAGAPQEVKVET
jgi:hypothetical protein